MHTFSYDPLLILVRTKTILLDERFEDILLLDIKFAIDFEMDFKWRESKHRIVEMIQRSKIRQNSKDILL